MFCRSTILAAMLSVCCFAMPAEAQLLKKLGQIPFAGKVKQASFLSGAGCASCDSGCAGGSCDSGSCFGGGCADPSCGCAAPSCGLAGSLLGGANLHSPTCGGPEPSCGSAGLGYSGGFGLCGGAGCDSCGTGGYFGRNLYKVNPCACGGSFIGDVARGFVSLVDRTVGAIVGTFFGGMQSVACHASGTFAALQSVAAAGCSSCGSMGCDGLGCAGAPGCGLASAAPSCGCVGPSCGAPACGAPMQLASPEIYSAVPMQSAPVGTALPSYSAPAASTPIYSQPAPPTPTPIMNGVPLPQGEPIMDSVPTPAAPVADPFIDDAPLSQVPRPQAVAGGFRVYRDAQPQQAYAGQAQRGGSYANHAYGSGAVRTASATKPVTQSRYLQSMRRPATLRR